MHKIKESGFYRTKFLFFLALFLLIFKVGAAYQSTGFKTYFTNYRPKESNQLWYNSVILQDKQGLIYVGILDFNTKKGKVLQYDGVSWRTIKGYNSGVRSMAGDDDGNIYIGGYNEIGFLTPDSNGLLQYHSLRHHLDKNIKRFADVFFTLSTKEETYFGCPQFLFRWNRLSKVMKIWKPGENNLFTATFSCRGKLFVQQQSQGLLQMENNELTPIPGSELFKEKFISMIVPYDAQNMLMGTHTNGLYLYNGRSFKSFPTEGDDYLKDKQLVHGIRLSSGDFALTTYFGGLVLIDAQGNLKEIFNKAFGLPDEGVIHVFEDSQTNLWLALENGVSKIEYRNPITINDNLSLNIYSIIKHRNTLYVGTGRGLFTLTTDGKFQHISGTSGLYFFLASVGDSIFAATGKGVFQVGEKVEMKIGGNFFYYILQSKRDPNRIWAGGDSGLFSLYNNNGRWEMVPGFDAVTQRVESIVQDNKGALWLGTNVSGNSKGKNVFKVELPVDGSITSAKITGYYITQATDHRFTWISEAADHLIFSTEKGLFRFNKNNKQFVPDHTFGKEWAGGLKRKGLLLIKEDKNKNIWLRSKTHIHLAQFQDDGSYIIHSKPFLRIQSSYWYPIYPDSEHDITWICGKSSLIRYQNKNQKRYDYGFQTLIRSVSANGKPVLGGDKTVSLINYEDRNLGFEFAAPFFEAETKTQ